LRQLFPAATVPERMKTSLASMRSWATNKGINPRELTGAQVRECLAGQVKGRVTDASVEKLLAALKSEAFEDVQIDVGAPSLQFVTPGHTPIKSLDLTGAGSLSEADFTRDAPPIKEGGLEAALTKNGFQNFKAEPDGASAEYWAPDARGDLQKKLQKWPSIDAVAKDVDAMGGPIPDKVRPTFERAERFAKDNGYNVVSYLPHRNAIRLEDVSGLHTSDRAVKLNRQLYLPL
jgi:hypothetical protein